MRCVLVSVGSEILQGDILNTNVKYLSQKLTELGIDVIKHISVGDSRDSIMSVIKTEQGECELIITTGGLGPTTDDLTKESIFEVLGLKSVVNTESLERLRTYFDADEYALQKNIKQAMFPNTATIIPNSYGTADGCLLRYKTVEIAILPGPPGEMIPMFESFLSPYLRDKTVYNYYSRFYRVTGMGEWKMEDEISDLLVVSTNLTIAPYAKRDGLVLKLRCRAKTQDEADQVFKPYEQLFGERYSSNFLGYDNRKPEEIVAEILVERGLSVSCAESITGGMLASKLIGYPGISSVLKESYIVYSDEAKEKVLKVNSTTLKENSAVSEETIREMLFGLHELTGADICIATTGYAGPGGEEVGLAYYGFYYRGEIVIGKRRYRGMRNEIRERVTRDLLLLLYRSLLEG